MYVICIVNLIGTYVNKHPHNNNTIILLNTYYTNVLKNFKFENITSPSHSAKLQKMTLKKKMDL